MATTFRNVQAIPAPRRQAQPSLWQRLVAAFKRTSIARDGELRVTDAIPEAVEATDRELSLLAKSGRPVPHDRLQTESLVAMYMNGLHS